MKLRKIIKDFSFSRAKFYSALLAGASWDSSGSETDKYLSVRGTTNRVTKPTLTQRYSS